MLITFSCVRIVVLPKPRLEPLNMAVVQQKKAMEEVLIVNNGPMQLHRNKKEKLAEEIDVSLENEPNLRKVADTEGINSELFFLNNKITFPLRKDVMYFFLICLLLLLSLNYFLEFGEVSIARASGSICNMRAQVHSFCSACPKTEKEISIIRSCKSTSCEKFLSLFGNFLNFFYLIAYFGSWF